MKRYISYSIMFIVLLYLIVKPIYILAESNYQTNQSCIPNTLTAAITFAPDGKYVAAGWSIGTTRVWETETGKLVHSYSHNTDTNIYQVTFSPDSKYLLTSGLREAILWDVNSAKHLHTFQHATDNPYGIRARFLSDGTQILTDSIDGAILWDAKTGTKVSVFPGNLDIMQNVQVSPNESYLLTSSGEDHLNWQLWNIPNRRELFSFNVIFAIGFTPDSKSLLIESNDGLFLWDIETQSKSFEFY